LHGAHVVVVGGADEVVVGDAAGVPGVAEDLTDPIGVCLRRRAGCGRGLRDLVAVLVGAGDQQRRVAARAVPARQRVGDDRRVRMAEVGLGVDVIERGW
jgi:hypothetical protein